jgi:FixH
MSARTRWIGIIVGLLVGNALAVAVLITMSRGEAARRVLPDYYQRAAAWDSTMAEAASSDALGWKVDVAVDGRELTLTATDRAGAALAGATVELVAVPRGRVDATLRSGAVEIAPGVYRVQLLGERRGLHDLNLHLRRGDDRFVADRVIELDRT